MKQKTLTLKDLDETQITAVLACDSTRNVKLIHHVLINSCGSADSYFSVLQNGASVEYTPNLKFALDVYNGLR